MKLRELCRTGSIGALACRGGHRSIRYRRLWPRREKQALYAFVDILSTRRARCKDVLCLGLNPNCSSRISPRSVTTCKILERRIFQIVYQ